MEDNENKPTQRARGPLIYCLICGAELLTDGAQENHRNQIHGGATPPVRLHPALSGGHLWTEGAESGSLRQRSEPARDQKDDRDPEPRSEGRLNKLGEPMPRIRPRLASAGWGDLRALGPSRALPPSEPNVYNSNTPGRERLLEEARRDGEARATAGTPTPPEAKNGSGRDPVGTTSKLPPGTPSR
jgi:hypothetical protein